jgi:hypothetical protein
MVVVARLALRPSHPIENLNAAMFDRICAMRDGMGEMNETRKKREKANRKKKSSTSAGKAPAGEKTTIIEEFREGSIQAKVASLQKKSNSSIVSTNPEDTIAAEKTSTAIEDNSLISETDNIARSKENPTLADADLVAETEFALGESESLNEGYHTVRHKQKRSKKNKDLDRTRLGQVTAAPSPPQKLAPKKASSKPLSPPTKANSSSLHSGELREACPPHTTPVWTGWAKSAEVEAPMQWRMRDDEVEFPPLSVLKREKNRKNSLALDSAFKGANSTATKPLVIDSTTESTAGQFPENNDPEAKENLSLHPPTNPRIEETAMPELDLKSGKAFNLEEVVRNMIESSFRDQGSARTVDPVTEANTGTTVSPDIMTPLDEDSELGTTSANTSVTEGENDREELESSGTTASLENRQLPKSTTSQEDDEVSLDNESSIKHEEPMPSDTLNPIHSPLSSLKFDWAEDVDETFGPV